MSQPSQRRSCFVISPIGEKDSDTWRHAQKVLRHIIRATLEPDYQVDRADENENPGAITPQIVNSIIKADLIVADISGGNANVFYELAIAHGYDKPTVHIQSVGDRVPFDIKDMRIIYYDISDLDSVDEVKRTLKKSAAYAVANPAEIDTPLKGAQAFKAVQSSGDPEVHITAQILEEVSRLRSEVRAELFTGGTDVFGGTETSADAAALRKVVSRAGASDRLKSSDFSGIVTADTSGPFDDWARKALSRVSGETDESVLNKTLYDEVMRRRIATLVESEEPPF